MDIQSLKNFLILSENLSFTKASEEAFIVQSALSKQIKQLEGEMDVSLFKRDKRNVELTPAGRYFKQEVLKLTTHLDFAIRRTKQIHRGEAGEIRIGYTHSVIQSFLPSLILTLNQRFPDLKTVLREMTNTDQTTALLNRDIDISFSPNPVIDAGVRSKVLLYDDFALVLPTEHPLTKENFNHIAQLSDENFILPPKTEGTRYVEVVESIFVDNRIKPNIVHETPYANTGIRLVQGGIGLTIEPVYGLKGYDNIKVIQLDNIPQKAELTMLWLPEFELEYPSILDLLNNFEYQIK